MLTSAVLTSAVLISAVLVSAVLVSAVLISAVLISAVLISAVLISAVQRRSFPPMSHHDLPITPAVRALRAANVAFDGHLYDYEEKGGTGASARKLGVDEHQVIKTLIMEDDAKAPMIVLMHGDKMVSTKELARQLGRRSVAPCAPEVAARHTGYLVGGTSPFGTKRSMPVFAEASVLTTETIYINGGKRGFLVSLKTADLVRLLSPVAVSVALTK